MSEGMFIACIIGATIVVLAVFYAVILFIACIIDQHKWEHEHSYDDEKRTCERLRSAKVLI